MWQDIIKGGKSIWNKPKVQAKIHDIMSDGKKRTVREISQIGRARGDKFFPEGQSLTVWMKAKSGGNFEFERKGNKVIFWKGE